MISYTKDHSDFSFGVMWSWGHVVQEQPYEIIICIIIGITDAGVRWPHNVLAMLNRFVVNEL